MNSPLTRRSSGILLHPTSLPGPFAHGNLGPGARQFVDFLEAAGQRWWQMLPIHPPGGCNSPYDSPSAFAGNEQLVSLEDLVPLGLLEQDEIREVPRPADPQKANFSVARVTSEPLLQRACSRLKKGASPVAQAAYDRFVETHDGWVWDYGLFTALKQEGDPSWTSWEPALRRREPEALRQAHKRLTAEVQFHVFCQFLFHFQWDKLRAYASQRGVLLMGDIPMFVSHNSVDVWANQGMFFLDEDGRQTVQAGVPPDYFSENGQLWGNPIYRWEQMRSDGYGWWIDRLRRELQKFDGVRIDHFIALSRYWEIEIGESSAKNGRYVDVPGYDFLEHAREALGSLPIIAEDLGIVTHEVGALRDHFELPGMKVLQFAFSPGAEGYLPHNHPKNCVAYLGTHDNGTTRGWFESLLERTTGEDTEAEAARNELRRIQGYAGVARTADANRSLIRSLLASPANMVFLTAQDLLDQGDEHRMNIPGVANGNWTYRMAPGQLNDEVANDLRGITDATGRLIE